MGRGAVPRMTPGRQAAGRVGAPADVSGRRVVASRDSPVVDGGRGERVDKGGVAEQRVDLDEVAADDAGVGLERAPLLLPQRAYRDRVLVKVSKHALTGLFGDGRAQVRVRDPDLRAQHSAVGRGQPAPR